jgi:ectoine hydroxylase-related dioxygenase (phytanoyl-CoA dioxygenase family)
LDIAQAQFEMEVFGFTVLDPLLTEPEVSRLTELVDAADTSDGTDYVYDGAFARHVANLPAQDDRFLALVDYPSVLALVESILGTDIVLGSMNARIVWPGDPEQGLHSDIPKVHRRPTGRPIMLQVVWMIDGFTTESGATRIVPGSHRAAVPAPAPERYVPHISSPVGAARSVLVFDGQCWHGGGANTGDARRRAVFAHYRVGP